MAENNPESPKPNDFNFEQAILELETIVERMERGEQPLEQAMQDFEYGMALSEKCKKSLDVAQLRMEQLIVRNGQESLESMESDSDEEIDGDGMP
ncbi:MAG: exodeoxyribonuclease VII small subunit [Gammaproteobacteria bacterium]|nr:exodeoxyribonuclease VII small subunit [Gammaproteobacteria bacterium]MCY4313911.1 exodeoxyribonuclease VII small subunit [Gammaproteobacteria bacterium]